MAGRIRRLKAHSGKADPFHVAPAQAPVHVARLALSGAVLPMHALTLVDFDEARIEQLRGQVGGIGAPSRLTYLRAELLEARGLEGDGVLVWLAACPPVHERLDQVLAKAGQAPVVVVTTEEDGWLGRDAMQAGAQDHLFDSELVGPRLARAFAHAQIRQRQQLALVQVVQQVSDSRAGFRALVDQNADGIVVVARSGRVQYVNPTAESLLADRADEILRRIFERPFQPDGPGELTVRGRDGKTRILELRVATGRWEQETDESYLATLRDVTSRRHAEAALARLNEDLARSNRDLEQFASVASHDLQEPLRMISSYVALLERKYRGRLDGDADAYIHFAVDGARRMRQLITDLLSYARVGRAVATLRPTSLERVFDEAVQNLHVAIAERRAIVTRGDLPIVMGDAVQLVQLLQNLLANAVKFNSSDPPRAAVTAEAVGSEWRICVADNGIGIESDHRERVFRIFQRLHPRGEYPGTGVGLAICRRIVERHGGRIWVESIPGEGTRLMWTLPTPQEA